MTVLAIDCGNRTGWARSAGTLVTSGAVDFTPKPGDQAGIRWIRFNDWLDHVVPPFPRAEGKPATDLVVYERWTRGLGDAPKIRAGFITRIEEQCDACGIARLEVSPAELKHWLTGNGHARKDAMRNAVLIKLATDRIVMSFDEADALALLHYALEKEKIG